MRERISLLKTLLFRPLWIVLGALSTLSWVVAALLPKVYGWMEGQGMIAFLSNPYHLIIMLLLITHVAIFEGFYRLWRPLQERYGGARVRAGKVLLTPIEQTVHGDILACMDVTNGEDRNLDNCRAQVIRAEVGSGPHWIDRTGDTHSGDRALIWPVLGDSPPVTTQAGLTNRFSVARLEANGRVVITHLHTGNAIEGGMQDRVYIEVEFRAEMDGKQIEPIIFRGFLVREVNDSARRLYIEPEGTHHEAIQESAE